MHCDVVMMGRLFWNIVGEKDIFENRFSAYYFKTIVI